MHRTVSNNVTVLFVCLCVGSAVYAQTKPRARDLGVPFDGVPGPLNAITEVKGVEVGHTTLILGKDGVACGRRSSANGPKRILPHEVYRERQRRDERHHLGRRIGLPRTDRFLLRTGAPPSFTPSP